MASDRKLPGERSAAEGRGCRERARACRFPPGSRETADSNSLINLNEVGCGAQEGAAGAFCLRGSSGLKTFGGDDTTRLWRRSQAETAGAAHVRCSRNQVPGPGKGPAVLLATGASGTSGHGDGTGHRALLQDARSRRRILPSMTRSRHRAAVVFRRIHVPWVIPREAPPGWRADPCRLPVLPECMWYVQSS